MAITEVTGVMKYKDAEGNTYIMLPATTKENVEGLEDIDAHLLDKENPHEVSYDQLVEKPFYERETASLINMDTGSNGTVIQDAEVLSIVDLYNAGKLKVVINNVEYTDLTYSFDGSNHRFATSDSVYWWNYRTIPSSMITKTEGSTWYYYAITTELKTLDEKYIPETIARTEDIPDISTKLSINQGTDNAGKVMTVGEDGNVVAEELPSDVFWVTYGVTTIDEIYDAHINQGKMVALRYAWATASTEMHTLGNVLLIVEMSSNQAVFCGVDKYGDLERVTVLRGSDGTTTWTPTSESFLTDGDVDSTLTSDSTDPVQGKVIYEALATKSDSTHTHDDLYDPKGSSDEALSEAKTYTDTVKNDLLNGAGEAYDTLKELGDLINENQDAIGALETVATGKADKVHAHEISDVTDLQTTLDSKAEVDHEHSWNDLEDKPFYTTTEYGDWLPETSIAIGYSDGQGAIGYVFGFTNTLTLDQTYDVVYKGEAYSCVCYDLQGLNAIGNSTLIGVESAGNSEPFLIGTEDDVLMIITDATASEEITISIKTDIDTHTPLPIEYIPDETEIRIYQAYDYTNNVDLLKSSVPIEYITTLSIDEISNRLSIFDSASILKVELIYLNDGVTKGLYVCYLTNLDAAGINSVYMRHMYFYGDGHSDNVITDPVTVYTDGVKDVYVKSNVSGSSETYKLSVDSQNRLCIYDSDGDGLVGFAKKTELDTLVDNLETKFKFDLWTDNVGKYLIIDEEGNLTPVEVDETELNTALEEVFA